MSNDLIGKKWNAAAGGRSRAKGCDRDAVRSTRKHGSRGCGLKWVTMMRVVPVP
jgi:hypothetical protein